MTTMSKAMALIMRGEHRIAQNKQTVSARESKINHMLMASRTSRALALRWCRAKGCGIGLFVSSELVKKMGSEISLISPVKDGKGSEFSFVLKLEKDVGCDNSRLQVVEVSVLYCAVDF